MKKLTFTFLIFVLLSTCCFAADFDGYIVKVKDNTVENMSTVSLFSGAQLMSELDDSEVVELISQELDSVEEINSDHMLLKVDSEESLQELIDLGIVESYEENSYL